MLKGIISSLFLGETRQYPCREHCWWKPNYHSGFNVGTGELFSGTYNCRRSLNIIAFDFSKITKNLFCVKAHIEIFWILDSVIEEGLKHVRLSSQPLWKSLLLTFNFVWYSYVPFFKFFFFKFYKFTINKIMRSLNIFGK